MAQETKVKVVAGGGLVDRRVFLKKGMTFSVAALVSESLLASTVESRLAWMSQPGKSFSNYGQPSEHERQTIRWTMANRMAPGNGVSWTPLHDLEGTITPNGLHFERHHNGVPQIDPKQHQLLIHGAVKKPLVFDMGALMRYPMT